MHPRVLIVGTVPYSKQTSARAFGTYFANWEKENLAQVFSNAKTPSKGHCERLYQITDERLLKRRINKKISVGKEFLYDGLDENSIETSQNKTIKKMYSVGSKRSSLRYLLRKFLWKKKYWNSPQFNQWLENFNPEAVFLSFSDEFFILEIALYVANKFNIPIISSTGDDYYFDGKFSVSILYHLYKYKYRRLVDKVLNYPGDIIYISDKIRDKYNEHFNRQGKTLYLTSDIKRREFKKISIPPKITYFGKIRMGRNNSLTDISDALYEINPSFKLDVYADETVSKVTKVFRSHPALRFNGSIPYEQVQDEMYSSDITIIVEGFKKKDILKSRYSLSTKVADSLRSGVNILAYGSKDCGAIEYLENTNGALVITKKSDLKQKITEFLDDFKLQKQFYENTQRVTQDNHVLEKNAKLFDKIVVDAIENYRMRRQK